MTVASLSSYVVFLLRGESLQKSMLNMPVFSKVQSLKTSEGNENLIFCKIVTPRVFKHCCTDCIKGDSNFLFIFSQKEKEEEK